MSQNLLIKALLFCVVCICMTADSSSEGSPIKLRSASSSLSCDFDRRNYCRWSNAYRRESADDFNWKLGSGSDGKQRGTGARNDHSGGGGYLYIKSKNKRNRTARVISPYINGFSSASCFKFWYLMNGRDMGHIEVFLADSRTQLKDHATLLWNLKGHQGNRWKPALIPLSTNTKGYLIIEAFDWEKGRSGNILLDDFKLLETQTTCQSVQPFYAAPPIYADVAANLYRATTTEEMTTASLCVLTSPTKSMNIPTSANFVEFSSGDAATTEVDLNQTSSYNLPPSFSTAMSGSRATIFTPFTNFNDDVGTLPSMSTPGWSQNYSTYRNTSKSVKNGSTGITVAIVMCILSAVVILVVALAVYLRRRSKKFCLNPVASSSIAMTAMFFKTSSEPSVNYTKVN